MPRHYELARPISEIEDKLIEIYQALFGKVENGELIGSEKD